MGKKNNSGQLSTLDLFSMAAGNIIGIGVMTMTGVGIALTGRSVSLAFIIGGIMVAIRSIPCILMGGTAKFMGGSYSYSAILGGKMAAGLNTVVNLAMTCSLSIAIISVGDYMQTLFPAVPGRLVGVLIFTLILLIHVVGVKQASILQNIMCLILSVALAMFFALGVGHVRPGVFSGPEFMTGGTVGFVQACIVLSFATSGANYVTNFSNVARNPKRDIPFVIIASTFSISIVYGLIATVDAGVLPVAEVAGKPLSVAAASFMPGPALVFFVVGGALFALFTTMNFFIASQVAPTVQAARDGWFPKILANSNRRFGTHHFTLIILWIIGAMPVLMGINLSMIANSTVIVTMILGMIQAYCALQMPKKIPELWERSKFHVSIKVLYLVSAAVFILSAASIVMLCMTSTKSQIFINMLIMAAGIAFTAIRKNYVIVEASYEE